MKHLATGWACNLNDLFVRFPYEKYNTLITKWRTRKERLSLIKRIFIYFLRLVIIDIIENNVTFKIQGVGYQGGEIHMERVSGKDFEKARIKGKFKKVDFLESLFTGYQMNLYIHGKRDNFLHRRKFPIYFGNEFKNKIVELTNLGKLYC